MKCEIKHRVTGEVLFSAEVGSLRLAVEAAITDNADLRNADLRNADLCNADLHYADLYRADLCNANLHYADLYRADLCNADLRNADLRNADLRNADLCNADLQEADLRNADLRNADLYRADLCNANLHNANLRYTKGVYPAHYTSLRLLLDQPGSIRMWKLVKASGEGPYNGGIVYKVGEEYAVEDANTDPQAQCAEGINLADLPWCVREWHPGLRILIAEFVADEIACIPDFTDGKFRVKRCRIVGEMDLIKLGLVKPEPPDAQATD